MAKPMKLLGRNLNLLSAFESTIVEDAARHGGFFNAHLHWDRANTLYPGVLAHIGTTPLDMSIKPLRAKQNVVGNVHTGHAFKPKQLSRRMEAEIKRQIALGVTRMDANVDATPDLPEEGLMAIRIALELREKYKKKIDIRVAVTPIFGLKKKRGKPSRQSVFLAAADRCQYLSLLPEQDHFDLGTKPRGRIGFDHHARFGLEAGCERGLEVQFHTDQTNLHSEDGTERLLDALRFCEQPVVEGANGAPTVWVVHMISPTAYNESRFKRLVDRLLNFNVGVIICPSAALSMRQLRSSMAPTHNSIARVLELIKAGVPLRFGTDNICDTMVPYGNGDMLTEMLQAGAALRLNSPSILAKLACGAKLNEIDLEFVDQTLREDIRACQAVDPAWRPALA